MSLRLVCFSILFLIVIGAYASLIHLHAQEGNLSTLYDEPRFQFETHEFNHNGSAFQIIMKLDRFTGQTWRFHAAKGEWSPIRESENASPNVVDYRNRYEFIKHWYHQTSGPEEEMILRVDSSTGKSWHYRGTSPEWKELSESAEDTSEVTTDGV